MPDLTAERSLRRSSTYGALRWVLAGAIVQRVVSVGCLAIIARLISKDDYGVFRELLSLHLICFVLLPVGFDQLYVRETKDRLRYAKAIRAAVMMSGGVLVTLIYLFRPWIANRLNLQQFSYLLYAFPAALVFQAAKLPCKVHLAAQLDFRRIGIGEFLNTFLTMAGGALLLVWWRSPAALYVAYAAGEFLEYVFLRFIVPGGTSLKESFAELRALGAGQWRFALFSSGDQALNAISANAPVLVLGGALSHASAANFSMASSLITMPLFLLVGALSKVALPSLAGRNEQDLQARALEILAGAAAYVVPVLIGVAFFAEPLVRLVLGGGWVEQTTTLVQLLAMYCIFVGLFSAISSLDVIRDRMDLGFTWNLATFVLRLGALAWGQRHGVTQAIAAYAIVSAVMWLINGFILGWLLRCGMWKFHRTWVKFVPLWCMLAATCAACNYVAGSQKFAALALGVVPALVYLGAVHIFYPSAGKLLTRLLASPRVYSALGLLRRGESTDLPTGGTGAGIP